MRRWSVAGRATGVLGGAALAAGCALAGQPGAPAAGPGPAAPGPVAPAVVEGVEALRPAPAGRSWAPAPVTAGGLPRVATAAGGRFVVHTASGEKDFLPGVNLGATVPGHAPGELAVPAERYRAWFPAVARMGLRAVRVYTVHPPAFYTELAAYNEAHPEAPLYLVQGVYLPDETYAEGEGTLFDAPVTDAFAAELLDASAAVHGDLRREPAPGRASGTWTADVSRWTVGWVIGVELDPHGVARTDAAHPGAPAVDGAFRTAPQATPTERWLAARMDELAAAEAARGSAAPIAFTNWPTTDPLRHPDEPIADEDLVGLDASSVTATDRWPAGTFASYHAYPYYPDFLRHEPGLAATVVDGRPDAYAGYLAALRDHHGDVPVLVTEFGVPSSLGSAHSGTLGRDQGGHTEAEAMAVDAALLRTIRGTGLGAGFVFAWTDEWFKATWNTVPRQSPAERRPLWHDPLTNEQWFGLVAVDPLGPPDGARRVVGHRGDAVREVGAAHDEAWLVLDVALPAPAREVDLAFDVLPAAPGPDYRVALDLAGGTAQALVRAALDPTALDRAGAPAAPPPPDAWVPLRLTTNRPLVVPTTGAALPAESQEVGRLRQGSWDPADPAYDSLATWRVDGAVLRVRLPWSAVGLADPSSRQALVVDGGTAATVPVAGLGLDLVVDGRPVATDGVTWQPWQRTHWRERVKAGAQVFVDAVADVTPR